MAKARRKTSSSKKSVSPLQSINKRISTAKAALKAGNKGASARLDKAINAKCAYNLRKGKASCRR